MGHLLLLIRVVLPHWDCLNFWRSVFIVIGGNVSTVHRGNESLLIGGEHIFELFRVLLVHLDFPPFGFLVDVEDKVSLDVFLYLHILLLGIVILILNYIEVFDSLMELKLFLLFFLKSYIYIKRTEVFELWRV